MKQLVQPPKLASGEKVAILSPSFAAPSVAPAVHEQALSRLTKMTGLVPVEFPTTRKLGATPRERAEDFNAALADPEIRGILATIGGEDQIQVVPFLDIDLLHDDPKPFLGYSDNTNILNWMWMNGVAGFYGGSTQVQLGPAPSVDPEQQTSLTAALLTGNQLEITEPGFSEDFGFDWGDPRALTDLVERERVEPWTWAGPSRSITGRTWGGCLDVIVWLALADRMPSNDELEGAVLLLETSEELPSADMVRWWLRGLGERGTLEVIQAVVFARSPASQIGKPVPDAKTRAAWREAQKNVVIETVSTYNPDVVMCIGPSFGHTKPQWIMPYGGEVTIDGQSQRVFASYS